MNHAHAPSHIDLMQQLQAQVLGRSGNLAPEVLQRAIQLGMGTGLHTDAAVENLLVKYENAEMIADMVMPVINRPKRSDFFRKMKPEIAFNIPDAKIASAEAMPNRANATLDTNGTYTVKDYGLMDFISADEEANADAPLEPRMESEEALMGYLMLAREKRAADVVFASGNYGSNTAALSGTDRWDNASSDPVAKILAVKKTPLVAPNTMVIGYEAWDYLRTNTNFMAYVRSRAQAGGSSTPLLIDEATVCRAFDLDRVVIGKAKYNSAREGATASYSYIWGKSCALIRVEPRPSVRKTQTFGYTFRYTAGGIPPFGVQVIANQLAGVRGGSFIKVGHSDDEVLVAGSNAGYLLTTVIS